MTALNSELRDKEMEWAEAVDQYVQERVALAKARSEVEAVQTQLKLLEKQVSLSLCKTLATCMLTIRDLCGRHF